MMCETKYFGFKFQIVEFYKVLPNKSTNQTNPNLSTQILQVK